MPVMKQKRPSTEAEAKYPKPDVRMLIGSNALGYDTAKTILGWIEVTEDDEVMFTDLERKRIRCLNNLHNRPLTLSTVFWLQQEILRGHWRFNMEPIIIGKNGNIISGQHRLIALVFACQAWHRSPDSYPHWTTEPVIEITLALGCDESDTTVNTVDTGKSRTDSDVIFRTFYQDLGITARKKAARRTEQAVQFLWQRTGASDYSFAPIQTRTETLDFISRHQQVMDCVLHITDLNKDDRIVRYIPPGTAAGLMYLMGASATERTYKPDDGLYGDPGLIPSERLIDWKHWERAKRFWYKVAHGDPELVQLNVAFTDLYRVALKPTIGEKVAILIKAWQCYVCDEPITLDGLKLNYSFYEDHRRLDELPVCGGIDLGRSEGVQE